MKILETRRLVLRRLESSDLDSLSALYGDPEVRRYFPEGTLTREETRAELEWFLDGHPEDPDAPPGAGLALPTAVRLNRSVGRVGAQRAASPHLPRTVLN